MEGNPEALKILLVYPCYTDTFWSFEYALKFVSKRSFCPPLGLLTVAALLPRTWKLRLVDLNVDLLKDEDILWADYVFLSAMDVQQVSAREVITRVKVHGKKIVAGGPLFTMAPDRFPEIDHLVMKEAETILPVLIEDLKKGEAKHIYSSNEWPDITSSPIPDWSLLDLSKYASMCIQYIRGCPFDCDFCAIDLLNGKEPRTKVPHQLLRELEALYQAGWRGAIFFGDDNFTVNPSKLKEELFPALIKWMEERMYPFFFFTQASINLIDDEELIKLMVKAGFDSVFLGIETLEEESLYECKKIQNTGRDVMGGVKKMQKLGLQVTGGFIVGFDNDSPRVFQEQIDFIQQSGIVSAMVGLLNPLRGTKLYERLQQEGRLIKEWTGDNTDFSLNFIPKMGYQTLLEGYKQIVTSIYAPRHFYTRLITFLKNYRPPETRRNDLQLRYIKTFFHCIWTLGLWADGRFYYWRTLLWTLLWRPKLFSVCMRLAIYGYHFRKVFEGGIKTINSLQPT